MNLRDLQYLVAVHEHKHFGRAAEACFATQPTLSAQIKKLEQELGVALIERASKGAMLTPVGEAIVARARLMLSEAENIREIARRAKDPHTGTLKLGAFPTLAPYFLPVAVPLLRTAFPRLTLHLVEEKTEELLRQLKDGRLDAALLALPIHEPNMHCEHLFDEPFLLATPKQHRLAAKRAIKVSDLRGESLMLLEDGHCLRDQALDVCHLAGAEEAHGFRATSLETLRQMVAAGVGITLLPAMATQQGLGIAQVTALVPFETQGPSREIGLIWRKSSPMAGLLAEVSAVLSRAEFEQGAH